MGREERSVPPAGARMKILLQQKAHTHIHTKKETTHAQPHTAAGERGSDECHSPAGGCSVELSTQLAQMWPTKKTDDCWLEDTGIEAAVTSSSLAAAEGTAVFP